MARSEDDGYRYADLLQTVFLGPIEGLKETDEVVREISHPPEGRYTPQADPIFRGGQGIIEKRRDELLERTVAVKVLGRPDHPVTFERFLREARLMAQLEHPQIVPIYDLAKEDDGAPSFTMKLVQGLTLKEVLDRMPAGPLSDERVLDLLEVVIKVCDALGYAHQRGVFHCDVKPENVMVGQFGEVYLMDWGIAELKEKLDAEPERSSSTVPVAGSLQYMAPEQARGQRKKFGPPTDVFGVGGLLYEITHRRAPRQGRNRHQALMAAGNHETPDIDAHVSPNLAAIIRKALAPDPDLRFATVHELRHALVRYVRGQVEFPVESYADGEVILQEGDVGDAAYIIEQGACQVTRSTPDGVESVRRMEVGELFGELALLGDGRRTATVTAIGDVVVRVLTEAVVQRELAAHQPWVQIMMQCLARRLRSHELTKDIPP